jgi:ribonuclease R
MTPPADRGPSKPLSHAIIELLADSGRAMHVAAIQTELGDPDYRILVEALDDLVYDGLVSARPGRRYKIAASALSDDKLDGSLYVNPRGFGFVRTAGPEDDVYINGDAMAGAMHRDMVRIRVIAETRRGREGEVVEVLERGLERVAGVLRGKPGKLWLEPDDTRIRGPIAIDGDADGAEPGLAALVKLTQFPEMPRENPEGEVVAVLGQPGDPRVEVAKILLSRGIEDDHPPKVLTEIQAHGDDIDPEEAARREDLRDVPLLTIDPQDARDHDDAVWVERDDDGNYRAWIAIADVSYYVQKGTALDAEAHKRGCSVYLPDRAVPMLPHALSGHLCSLVEGKDRLCLCVEVDLDATGGVTGARIVEGVMRSRAFLTYPSVARALGFTTEPPRDPRAEELRHELRVAWDLAGQLRKRRMRRGALDFDLPEARIDLDDDTGAPVGVTQRGHDPGVRKAYRLVEEMMLLANEVVARHVLKQGVGSVFRIHGAPDPEKVERLGKACEALAVEFDPDDLADPKRLSKWLRKIEGHEKKKVLHNLLLRAMQQASYSTQNIGHFGLASEAYLHFTSPIRRYPDLVVHRRLRAWMRSGRPKPTSDERPEDEALNEAALVASQRERNAMEAEREVSDVYRALYMKRHVGERFDATVTAITPRGLYLRIEAPFVDVLVTFDGLGVDEYEPDEASLKVVGKRSGDSVTLGDTITVEIEDASVLRRAVYARRVSPPNPRPRTSSKDKKRQRKQSALDDRRSQKSQKRKDKKGKDKKGKDKKGKDKKGKRKKRR